MTDRPDTTAGSARGRALVWRALVTAVSTPALWGANGAQIVLFLLYMLVWGDGLPVAGARPVLEQFAKGHLP